MFGFENIFCNVFLGLIGLWVTICVLERLVSTVRYILYKPLPDQCRRYLEGMDPVWKLEDITPLIPNCMYTEMKKQRQLGNKLFIVDDMKSLLPNWANKQMKKERQQRKEWLHKAIESVDVFSDDEEKGMQKKKCKGCCHCKTG